MLDFDLWWDTRREEVEAVCETYEEIELVRDLLWHAYKAGCDDASKLADRE